MKKLRIFYASDHTPNANLLESRIWYTNLFLPLSDLGHDIVPFDYDLAPHFQNLDPAEPNCRDFIRRNRPKLEHALLEQVERAHKEKPIDVFFSYFFSACVTPETIRAINRMGICTVNWYCNASYQFHLIEDIAPAYDFSLVAEKFRMDDYRRIGANPIYCQMAANPNIYKPLDLPVEYDVTFIGARYGERAEYVRHLYDEGIGIRVWGPGWRRDLELREKRKPMKRLMRGVSRMATSDGWKAQGRRIARAFGVNKQAPDAPQASSQDVEIPQDIAGIALSDDEMIKMYSRSKISIGFSQAGDISQTGTRIMQVRLRDFEGPMCGAFYMVEYMEEIEDFYDIGKEIVCYSNKEDLAEKIKFYIKNEDEREKIRKAGYKRAKNEHTWHNRFETTFKRMGFD